MNLQVKHMISKSCILMAKEKLADIGVFPDEINLGRITLKDKIPDEKKLKAIERVFNSLGFELIKKSHNSLIPQIREVIRKIVYQTDERPSSNYSKYIHEELGYDYSYLSKIYSQETGKTIQQSIIELKIERAIDLIEKDVSFKEISYVLHYSSLAHFCSQFKKMTGLTPTQFKEEDGEKRKTIFHKGKAKA